MNIYFCPICALTFLDHPSGHRVLGRVVSRSFACCLPGVFTNRNHLLPLFNSHLGVDRSLPPFSAQDTKVTLTIPNTSIKSPQEADRTDPLHFTVPSPSLWTLRDFTVPLRAIIYVEANPSRDKEIKWSQPCFALVSTVGKSANSCCRNKIQSRYISAVARATFLPGQQKDTFGQGRQWEKMWRRRQAPEGLERKGEQMKRGKGKTRR